MAVGMSDRAFQSDARADMKVCFLTSFLEFLEDQWKETYMYI